MASRTLRLRVCLLLRLLVDHSGCYWSLAIDNMVAFLLRNGSHWAAQLLLGEQLSMSNFAQQPLVLKILQGCLPVLVELRSE